MVPSVGFIPSVYCLRLFLLTGGTAFSNMKPRKLGRVVLKEEFFAITGCLEEAIVLNQMCYWSERVQETDKFLEEEYTMLVEHVPVLAYGWIYKSASELAGELFGAVSEKTMNRILDRLVKKNFLRRRFNPNPKYKFDKTYHYRVNFVEIMCQLKKKNMPLSGYQIIEECVDRLERGVAPKRHFDGSEHQVDGAIPETTSETTSNTSPIVPLNGELPLSQGAIAQQTKSDDLCSRPPQHDKAQGLRGSRKSPPTKKPVLLADDAYFAKLSQIYPHLDMEKESKGMDAWLLSRPHRPKSQAFAANWINRAAERYAEKNPKPQKAPDEKTDPVAAGLYWKNLVNRD
jgi:DNA-binding MarR family transcriptional regulator